MLNIKSEQKIDVPVGARAALEDDDVLIDPEQKKRLDYLLKQAEVFAHFVTNGSKGKKVDEVGGKRKAKHADINSNKKSRTENGSTARAHSVEEKLVQYDQTPNYIEGEMRDYQLKGLNWLISLYENGISGILGDEMGLGKTLQTISILGYLKHVKKIDGPFLVVAPLSTIHNWMNEVNRFCPTLRAFILQGTKDERKELLKKLKWQQESWDLCVTTYDVSKIEKFSLQKPSWQYIVLDEGHKIKNEKSMVNQALCSIKSEHRLMLTGTPLQNNLHELWVLLNYLLPDIFANAKDFDTWFDSDVCLSGNQKVVQRLHGILGTFMLRRIKADVEKSLLPKQESKLYVGMTDLQRKTYIDVLLRKVKTINSLGEVSMKVINMIVMELRKAANHPYLIDEIEPKPYTTDQHLVDSCGKLKVLDQLLERLKSQGSRVVLFSQFVIVLNIIEDYLVWKGYKFCRLDGSTPLAQRASDVDDFNAPNSDIFIFMISTRAGNLGINLATADTVILHDTDWNPQIDFQAIDRVHRIGQKKQVHVYRLITEDTIDQRIVQRAAIKERLDNIVIQNSRRQGAARATGAQPNKAEIVEMIKMDAERIMSTKTLDLDFDLDKIIEASAQKDAAEKQKLADMTLEAVSSTSVYQFENTDFRAKQTTITEIPTV